MQRNALNMFISAVFSSMITDIVNCHLFEKKLNYFTKAENPHAAITFFWEPLKRQVSTT